jgi:hypothetical protein
LNALSFEEGYGIVQGIGGDRGSEEQPKQKDEKLVHRDG